VWLTGKGESCRYLRYEEEAAKRVEGRSARDPAAEEVVDGHVGAGGEEGGGLGVVPWSACLGEMGDGKYSSRFDVLQSRSRFTYIRSTGVQFMWSLQTIYPKTVGIF
jgi:hypothetical protein